MANLRPSRTAYARAMASSPGARDTAALLLLCCVVIMRQVRVL